MTIEYVMVMHDGDKATKFMSEGYCKDLMEQLAAAQSQEVCTVAHENVETCGYCQRDALTAESAALREERALIIQRAENAEAALVEAEKQLTFERGWNCQGKARLAEAEALLRDVAAVVYESTGVYGFHMNGDLETWDYWPVFARIDAHLAREGKP